METVTHTTKRFYLPEQIFDLSAMSLLNRRQAAAVRIIEWCPKFLLLPGFQIRRPLYLSGEPNGSGTDSTPARFRLKD